MLRTLCLMALTACLGLLNWAALTACGDGGGERERADGRLRIAVITKGPTHSFWKAVEAGARQAAGELDIEMLWQPPRHEGDRRGQIDIIRRMIQSDVDGIVLAPVDARGLVRPVREAHAAGIPVVIIDSGLHDAEDYYLSFIATDNLEGGRIGGRHLAELLADAGNKDIIILRYEENHESTENREAGMIEAAGEGGLNFVRDRVRGGTGADTALRAAESMLHTLRGGDGGPTFTGVLTPNESTTVGMLQALRRVGWAGQVRFVGFDVTPGLASALQRGDIDALVAQNPHRMGYEGVRQIVAGIRGEEIPRRIDTGVMLVTTENIDDPEIQALIPQD